MIARKPNTRQLSKKLTLGKKPKSWPGGTRSTTGYKTRVSQMEKTRKRVTRTSKYGLRTQRAYHTVDQSKGPAIYGRSDVYETLYRLGEFSAGKTYKIADLACGKGLVGAKVAGLAAKAGAIAEVSFMDLGVKKPAIEQQMEKEAPGVLFRTMESDVRHIAGPPNRFDHTYCRFAIKNMQPQEQAHALREIFRVTKKGGVFVLNDMVSPSDLQAFQNAERRAKAASAGSKASHHVPTETEWIRKLRQAGFVVEKIEHTTSDVHTGDWVSSGQATQNGLRSYYAFLQTARKRWPAAWRQYNIRPKTDPLKGAGFQIIYPVVYIRCRKP